MVKGYTEKQWGRSCTELPPSIIKRLPVRLAFDNNYFNDKWQGIPIGGYNALVERLLDGVETRTGCDWLLHRPEFDGMAEKVVYTGALDEYFGYCEGRLQYRTVRFETTVEDTPNYQGNAVVNYTDRETPWTRIIEHKHFEMFGQEVYDCPKTVISKEFPMEWVPGLEPYYPINDAANDTLYGKYRARAEAVPNLIIGGRLAEYKYYDMAPTIANAMKIFNDNEIHD